MTTKYRLASNFASRVFFSVVSSGSEILSKLNISPLFSRRCTINITIKFWHKRSLDKFLLHAKSSKKRVLVRIFYYKISAAYFQNHTLKTSIISKVLHPKTTISDDLKSFIHPLTPGCFLDILVLFKLDLSQSSFNPVENAFATQQLAFLATSIAFYPIVTRARAEIEI